MLGFQILTLRHYPGSSFRSRTADHNKSAELNGRAESNPPIDQRAAGRSMAGYV